MAVAIHKAEDHIAEYVDLDIAQEGLRITELIVVAGF